MLTLKQLNSVPRFGRATDGTEISSRNAIKHGACATATLILDSELIEDYQALETRWFQGYNVTPASGDSSAADTYEAELIRTAARAEWFFLRAERNYAEAEALMLNAVPDVLMWGNDHHNTLTRFLRYRTTNANAVTRHRKAIEDYRKNRAAELARLQASQLQDEKLATAKVKLEIIKQKSRPEGSGTGNLETMSRNEILLADFPADTPSANPDLR